MTWRDDLNYGLAAFGIQIPDQFPLDQWVARISDKPATNTIIVTHRPNILDALGKDWFDVKEGEASIFHVENGASRLIARVQMDEWARIATAK